MHGHLLLFRACFKHSLHELHPFSARPAATQKPTFYAPPSGHAHAESVTSSTRLRQITLRPLWNMTFKSTKLQFKRSVLELYPFKSAVPSVRKGPLSFRPATNTTHTDTSLAGYTTKNTHNRRFDSVNTERPPASLR